MRWSSSFGLGPFTVLALSLMVAYPAHSASQLTSEALETLRRPPKTAAPAKPIPQRATDWKGTNADDSFTGSAENDRMSGGARADSLFGADGNDDLSGDDGDDYLDGQNGNDHLNGGPGNDRYRFFGEGAGADTIDDTFGRNTLLFVDASNPMVVDKHGDEYVITYGGDRSIRMRSATFDTLQFLSLSTLLDREEFLQLYGKGEIGYPRRGKTPQGKVSLTAGPMGQQVDGSGADEILIGGVGEDVLLGGGGNDEFRPGGPSGAAAIGGAGNDVYVFGRNDGRLMIRDEGGVDQIRMGSGIQPSDVSVTANANQVIFLVQGTAQAADSVKGEYRWSIQVVRLGGVKAGSIESVVFADGTIWNDLEKRVSKN